MELFTYGGLYVWSSVCTEFDSSGTDATLVRLPARLTPAGDSWPARLLALEVGAFDPMMQVCGGMPEDIVLVTEDGIENLTRYLSHDLWIAK